MLPMFWLWSPSFNWPFSGDVAQDISPDTSWFFGAIPPKAGVGAIEKKVFETASYGRQLGLMMDVLIALGEQASWPDAQAQACFAKLKDMRAQIEAVKAKHREELVDAAQEALQRLQRSDPEALRKLLARFPSV